LIKYSKIASEKSTIEGRKLNKEDKKTSENSAIGTTFEKVNICKVYVNCLQKWLELFVRYLIRSAPTFMPIPLDVQTWAFKRDNMRSEVLTATSTKKAVIWVVAPCSLVEVYPTFQRYLLPPSSGL
jgi:hypothetical protein